RRYALLTQPTVVRVASNAVWRVGTAMLTMVVSTMMTKKPRQSAGRMLHGLRPPRSTSATVGAGVVGAGVVGAWGSWLTVQVNHVASARTTVSADDDGAVPRAGDGAVRPAGPLRSS